MTNKINLENLKNMGEKKKKIKKNKRKEKRKKKPHFRGTFQICKSEVKQLQIYIDKKSISFFFFEF